MGHAVGDVLGLAAAVAVSALPIIALILILATPRGRRSGLLFTVGWSWDSRRCAPSMLAIGGPGGASTHHHAATWVGGLKLALGTLLVLLRPEARDRRLVDLGSVTNPEPFTGVR